MMLMLRVNKKMIYDWSKKLITPVIFISGLNMLGNAELFCDNPTHIKICPPAQNPITMTLSKFKL
jgi:hypothetical protein